MPNESLKLKSWQFFHFFRKHFGREVLYSIWGTKNSRTVDYWSQDPLFTGKPAGAFDPIKGVKLMIDRLDNYGYVGDVRSLMAYLVSGTSIDSGDDKIIVEPKATLTEEQLLDFTAVAHFHRAIESEDDPDVVQDLKVEALEEIERTWALYLKKCSGKTQEVDR